MINVPIYNCDDVYALHNFGWWYRQHHNLKTCQILCRQPKHHFGCLPVPLHKTFKIYTKTPSLNLDLFLQTSWRLSFWVRGMLHLSLAIIDPTWFTSCWYWASQGVITSASVAPFLYIIFMNNDRCTKLIDEVNSSNDVWTVQWSVF